MEGIPITYNGTIYRPPTEANTFLIPITEGCTHMLPLSEYNKQLLEKLVERNY